MSLTFREIAFYGGELDGSETAHSLTMPSTVHAGDLLLVAGYGLFDVGAPSGWTPIATYGPSLGLPPQTRVLYGKVADGSEDGTTVDFPLYSSMAGDPWLDCVVRYSNPDSLFGLAGGSLVLQNPFDVDFTASPWFSYVPIIAASWTLNAAEDPPATLSVSGATDRGDSDVSASSATLTLAFWDMLTTSGEVIVSSSYSTYVDTVLSSFAPIPAAPTSAYVGILAE